MNRIMGDTARLDQPQIFKGDRLTLSLVSWGRLGEAMAKHQDRDIFVFGGIPGEQVEAEITRVARKYIAARVVRVLEPSADRIAPPCPYFGDCTGCQWQHVSYDRQLAIKKELVADALSRVGNFSAPPVSEALAAPQQYSYRNHARFTVREGGLLGYVNSQSRRFVRIDHCMLMHQGINHLLTQLQGKCAETSQLSIRAGKDTGDFLVQPRLANSEIQPPTGQKHYCDSVAGRRFKVASPSFFQVNVDQAAQLVQVVRQSLELNGTELLLDAYAGVGSFAILLAPHVRQVIAVEESAAAVADARENAAGLGNITFILGKAEEVLKSVRDRPDVAVLDPPRAGCHPQALDHLIQLAPRRIVYVACDAETMARDLKILCSSHYQLERVQPVDMFPQTYHVESVASLTRRQGPDLITLASASPRRRELLNELGLEFQVLPSHAPEEALTGESPQQLVERLSLAKASAVAPGIRQGYVMGADSVVVLEGRVLGKPSDPDEARRMLRDLRGARHYVITGFTVLHVASGRAMTDSLASTVIMRNYSDAEIEASITSGTPMDKAGGYAVQDQKLLPAERLEGCYTNVVGLPICGLIQMLTELGYNFPPDARLGPPESCHHCVLARGKEPC